jgi:positive regulator of sigma E activity
MAGTRPSPDQEPPLLARAAGQYLGWGLMWALSTALFLFLGWLVDGWLSTKPLFTIVGAFVGAGAGFYSLYHHLTAEQRAEEERRKREREGRSS